MADPRRAQLLAALAQSTAAAAAALGEQARAYAELAQLEAAEAGVRVDVPVVAPGPANDGVRGERYATAEDNPLGTARGFLNAHRRKAFPTFKRGRTIAARWADVEAWMTDPARRAKVPPPDLEGFDEEAAYREAFGPQRRRRKAS